MLEYLFIFQETALMFGFFTFLIIIFQRHNHEYERGRCLLMVSRGLVSVFRFKSKPTIKFIGVNWRGLLSFWIIFGARVQSDLLVFFNEVRVDPYLLNWTGFFWRPVGLFTHMSNYAWSVGAAFRGLEKHSTYWFTTCSLYWSDGCPSYLAQLPLKYESLLDSWMHDFLKVKYWEWDTILVHLSPKALLDLVDLYLCGENWYGWLSTKPDWR